LNVWWQACRPKTLSAAVVPVAIGSASAAVAGGFSPWVMLSTLGFALCVQVTCNFANDLGDFVRGADTPARLGPVRAVASGKVSARAMRFAVGAGVALAFFAGLPLVFWVAWWLVAVGVLCLLACLAYTAGPFPLAYRGWGDVFVVVFFGFVAVLFSAYVQCGSFPAAAWVGGLGCGLLATNILIVNNARDMETDALAGKRTTVVRFGRGFARRVYAGNLALALLAVGLLPVFGMGRGSLLPLLLGPLALRLGAGFWNAREARACGSWLGRTAAFLLAYGATFVLGLWLGQRL
jgi:1,4-dihydroxy-2-naphthoate octaprenyltransferase